AVGGPLLDPDQVVLVVVAVGPGLGAGALRLLGDVAFVVVRVRPGAIACHPVASRGRITGHFTPDPFFLQSNQPGPRLRVLRVLRIPAIEPRNPSAHPPPPP